MATDIVQKLLEALVAITRADATLQALLDRADKMVVPWQAIEDVTLPIIFYVPVVAVQHGGSGDTRLVEVQFTAVAQGPNAQGVCNALVERLEQVLTQPALLAQGVDAAPFFPWTRRFVSAWGSLITREGGRALARSDLDATFIITK